MKSCDFRTSEASYKAWLRTNNIIDKFLNVKDLNKFRASVTKVTNIVRIKLGIDEGRLMTDEEGKVIINKKAFHTIDAKKGIYYPENSYLLDGSMQPEGTYEDTLEEVGTPEPTFQTLDQADIQEFVESEPFVNLNGEENKIHNKSELSSVGEQLSFDFEKLFSTFDNVSPVTREQIANAIKDGDLTIQCKL